MRYNCPVGREKSNKFKRRKYERKIWKSLHWRHIKRDGGSNHHRLDYLLNRLFRHRQKKTSKLASLAFVRGIYQWLVKSPHKESVTRKMFPFHDVIMFYHKSGKKELLTIVSAKLGYLIGSIMRHLKQHFILWPFHWFLFAFNVILSWQCHKFLNILHILPCPLNSIHCPGRNLVHVLYIWLL